MTDSGAFTQASDGAVRSRAYQFYIVGFSGLVALMDQYLSSVESTAIPYILAEFQIEAAQFATLKSRFLIVTFFVFALNGLNDLFGRRPAMLALILLLGLSSLSIVLFTPTLLLFMTFYALAMYATVSNMWAIAVGEEAPATSRARLIAVVFAISLVPAQAYLPLFVVERLGLDWRWTYGVMFVVMIPVLVLWFFMRETGRYRAVEASRKRRTGWRTLVGSGALDRRDLRYVALTGAVAIGVLVAVTLVFWAGYFFMNLRGYTLGRWSTMLFAFLSAEIAGGLCGGWLLDRVGRNRIFVIAGVSTALALGSLGFLPPMLLLPVFLAIGFFMGVISTWIFVYIAEVFPTERRGTCVGWVTSLSRVAYVAGPALAALLLRAFPNMQGFWVVAGLVMLIPAGIVLVFRPFETRGLALEEIAAQR